MKKVFVIGALTLMVFFGGVWLLPKDSEAWGGGPCPPGPGPGPSQPPSPPKPPSPPPGGQPGPATQPEQHQPGQPFTPNWVDGSDYGKAISKAMQQKHLILIAFCSGEKTEKSLRALKIINPSQELLNLEYVLVILTEAEAKIVPKLVRSERALHLVKNNDREKEAQKPDESLSPNGKLALEYKVKRFPRMIFCDWYGNALGRTSPDDFKTNARSLIKKMLEQQVKLEQLLAKQFESAEKRYKKEAAEGEFTLTTISMLRKIADYKGYEPTEKARGYLEEINKVGEEELSKICEKIGQEDNKSIISELVKIKHKYKYLPVAKKAEEKINELKDKEEQAKK